MTSVPIGSNIADAVKASKSRGLPMSPTLFAKYGPALAKRGRRMFSQFEGAEILCEKYNITREEMELFAVESHKKATKATKAGLFKVEIISLALAGSDPVTMLEGPIPAAKTALKK